MCKSELNRKKDEAVTDGLRALFELRGFVQARVNKFEEYDLYIENRNFLDSESIITFMDVDGRLKSMKPDVTLSIVKNMPRETLSRTEKLYYIDEVCRLSRDTREYKMRGQAGVELIGPPDPFLNLEAVDLALESLAVIGGNYILDISHLGFVSGLLDTLDIPLAARSALLSALHTKSAHIVAAVLDENNVLGKDRANVISVSELSGGMTDMLPRAEKLISNRAMADAFAELRALGEMLEKCGTSGRVKLDFSVVNDLDYYNGLIFQGYVEGMPDVVLTGGRYDNLLKKMGKKSGAIGFAVSLSELNTYFKSSRDYNFDALIAYTPGADYPGLISAAKKLAAEGKSVRLERADISAAWVCRETYIYDTSGLRGAEIC